MSTRRGIVPAPTGAAGAISSAGRPLAPGTLRVTNTRILFPLSLVGEGAALARVIGAASRAEQLCQDRDQLVRAVLDLAPRGADHAPPGRRQALIAAAVGLEGLTGAVRPVPVDLDDETLPAPHEVGPDRGLAVAGIDEQVGLGRG